MVEDKLEYPKYYDVDGVPIVLELEGDEVVGKVANGKSYPIGKAIVEGYEITKAEFDRLKQELYG